jgi:orotate phosphoribosyltransferase
VTRPDEIRAHALEELRRYAVLMLDGHFDYGNGYHGRAYLNPHQLFRYPSTIWRLAQDLLDLVPSEMAFSTEVVAGPATGGALLAHTIAGLLDSRRSLTHPPCSFAPFGFNGAGELTLRDFYRQQMRGKRVLLADDVRNTGQTLARASALVGEAGGSVLGAVVICDRMEPIVGLDVPLVALVEYRGPENFPANVCPLCAAGLPITSF